MSRLVVISNRVSMPTQAGAATAGGLAMALAAALREYKGVWFGWSGRIAPEFTGELAVESIHGVTVATVDLEEQDVQEYYNGFANETLWPLFHYRIDLSAFERAYGQGYERVNTRFAQTARPLIDDDDLVWVHDYHLIPMGRELRRMGVRNPIGFFLHIPWPSHQLFTALPRHRQLVEAMFQYDLVGFQTQDYLDSFLEYVRREADGEVLEGGRVRAFGRTILAQAFPIGIDTENFQQISESMTAAQSWDRMVASTYGRSVIVGVDRLDYAKGLEERMLAYEQFLNDNPERLGSVEYLQIAPPSREDVDAYQDIRARLDAHSGRINGAFSTINWTPIRYVIRSYGRDELAGVYRASRVALVTPLRDGMNLVAKEYVAAQSPRDPGVLILSRFAGAAAQMGQALIVNPYSREDVSDAIRRALSMEPAERRRRWEILMHGVQRHDVAAWRDDFVTALRESQAEPACVGA
ncbi:MAG: alpha,alpha-trehalose-phosphate synthase (UDP-forming) [Caulobacteraceae bacterium]